jgi:hypothetical protein
MANTGDLSKANRLKRKHEVLDAKKESLTHAKSKKAL